VDIESVPIEIEFSSIDIEFSRLNIVAAQFIDIFANMYVSRNCFQNISCVEKWMHGPA
jgi:hypothetical protein